MNILIPDSWLRDFLETAATPQQIAEALSLHSASVERVEKQGNDWVYNIEITTNRVDMFSVYGLAREAAAALQQRGIKAHFNASKINAQKIPEEFYQNNQYLKVKILKQSLCPRFTTILCEGVIKPSPGIIQERLTKSGLRPINNVVDITNYLMLETGQPMHAFDFDKINSKQIIMRPSKKNEEIVTLDGIKRNLKGDDILIEDDRGRLIDLCGIMGGLNTSIDSKTRKILLFIQTYDPVRIRRTIQSTGLRSEAASRFEKGLDPEMVLPAMLRACDLLKTNAGAKLIGGLIDLYTQPYQTKQIMLETDAVKKIIGVEFSTEETKKILESLGFNVSINKKSSLMVKVPSWRAADINIREDLIEEIARMYGYHKLPSEIAPLFKVPETPEINYFYWQKLIKNLLKYQGFNETYTYSLIPETLLKKSGFEPKKFLKIANPFTEAEYLRPSLIPSALEFIKENQDRVGELAIFELANIYLPAKEKEALPLQTPRLCITSNAHPILELKKTTELIFHHLGIKDYRFIQKENIPLQADIMIKDKIVGKLYQLDTLTLRKLMILKPVAVVDLDLQLIVSFCRKFKKYQPLSEYPPLLEDLTFVFPEKTNLGPVIEIIEKQSSLIQKVAVHNQFGNNFTFRITYQSQQKSLSSSDIVIIRKKLISNIENSFGAKIKA